MQFIQTEIFHPQKHLFPLTKKPAPTVELCLGTNWESIRIHPDQLANVHECKGVDDDAWCKKGCKLAFHIHPMVAWKPGVYTKYCTADVIREIPAARPLVRAMVLGTLS